MGATKGKPNPHKGEPRPKINKFAKNRLVCEINDMIFYFNHDTFDHDVELNTIYRILDFLVNAKFLTEDERKEFLGKIKNK